MEVNMKNKIFSILLAIIIVSAGVILIGNELFDWNVSLFIKGWWALLLSLMFLCGMIKDGPDVGNIVGVLLFGFLFAKNYIPAFDDVNVWVLVLGALIISIGVGIIKKNFFRKNRNVAVFTSNTNEGSTENFSTANDTCAFSSARRSYAGETFSGGDFRCSFGSFTIDLRGASVTEGSILRANCAFGDMNIIVPADIDVKLTKSSFFGSVSGDFVNSDPARLYIDAECGFGSIKIIRK